MSGLHQVHFALGTVVSNPNYHKLAVNSAVSSGQCTYHSNPYYLHTRDNSGDILSDGYL